MVWICTHWQKKTFKFSELVLIPRSFDYQIQFCGPTGTNAVEAALKLAKKKKNRTEYSHSWEPITE